MLGCGLWYHTSRDTGLASQLFLGGECDTIMSDQIAFWALTNWLTRTPSGGKTNSAVAPWGRCVHGYAQLYDSRGVETSRRGMYPVNLHRGQKWKILEIFSSIASIRVYRSYNLSTTHQNFNLLKIDYLLGLLAALFLDHVPIIAELYI